MRPKYFVVVYSDKGEVINRHTHVFDKLSFAETFGRYSGYKFEIYRSVEGPLHQDTIDFLLEKEN